MRQQEVNQFSTNAHTENTTIIQNL